MISALLHRSLWIALVLITVFIALVTTPRLSIAMPANDQMIINSLKEKGIITKDMSEEEVQHQLRKYLGQFPKEPNQPKPPHHKKTQPKDKTN
ncbi:hypothetical protein [Grimontia indica]|uniref:hypothetical protein n=1 Tax=Grimontia indica TaxID=1056512 RepID=UPI000586501F|nr:hypothetical protein [Grimontia indica]